MFLQEYCKCCLLLFLSLTHRAANALPVSEVADADNVLIRTVPYGTTVILQCRSNDLAHNFQYWHLLNSGQIIGPANEFDKAKYRFEVLSGNLTIRAVSRQEEGLYECVSRGVKGENMNVRVVRMLVQRDLEDVYENDYHINIIRVLIAAITLLLVSMGAWFVYRIWKDRYRYPSYLQTEEEDDDDSTEELFSQPSTSKQPNSVNNVSSKQKSIVKEPSPFDDVDISTDFKSILDAANEK